MKTFRSAVSLAALTAVSVVFSQDEITQVPQYFRYNQLFDLAIDFPQKSEVAGLKDAQSGDQYFSHMFKEINSEYLLDGDDGEFVKMVCSTELDLSHETQLQSRAQVNGNEVWW